MAKEIRPKTELARRIFNKINELRLDLHDVGKLVRVGYERIRQVVGGDSPPSVRLLQDLAAVLELDYGELEFLLVVDGLRKKHPAVLLKLAGFADPELKTIHGYWCVLTPEQREHVLLLLKIYAERNTGDAAHTDATSRSDTRKPN